MTHPSNGSVPEVGKRIQGRVRRILYDKGYGFAEGLDGNDYFFHWSGVSRRTKYFRDIKEGDRVEFSVEPDDKNRGFRVVKESLITL